MENGQPTSNNLMRQINTTVDFKRLLGAILTNWHWIILSVLLSSLIAFLYLRYTTPIYSVTSRLLIEQRDVSPASNILTKFSGGGGEGGSSDPNLYNEMFLLTSQDLVTTVVDSLGLNVQYYTEGRVNDE